jgi:aspartyl/asparaginyl-tRNA synthetase
MDKLYKETASQLIARLRSGEATAADFKNAIQMLKDNDITAVMESCGLLSELEDALEENFPENNVVIPFPT